MDHPRKISIWFGDSPSASHLLLHHSTSYIPTEGVAQATSTLHVQARGMAAVWGAQAHADKKKMSRASSKLLEQTRVCNTFRQ